MHQACPARHEVCICPSCTPRPHLMSGTVSERWARWRTAIRGDWPLYPRGPRSGPSYSVSVHLHLSASCAPLLGTSRLRGIAAYTECLRCAGAPRRPRSGSVLSLFVPGEHAVLSDPGESIGCTCPALHQWHWPSPRVDWLGTPLQDASSASDTWMISWLYRFARATACPLACPSGGSDRVFLPANRDFYSRAFGDSVALLTVGYNYGGI